MTRSEFRKCLSKNSSVIRVGIKIGVQTGHASLLLIFPVKIFLCLGNYFLLYQWRKFELFGDPPLPSSSQSEVGLENRDCIFNNLSKQKKGHRKNIREEKLM